MIRVNMPLNKYGDEIYQMISPLVKQHKPVQKKGWLLDYVKQLDCYTWCENNCCGEFKFTIGSTTDYQLWLDHFYFEFEKLDDALLFKVMWG